MGRWYFIGPFCIKNNVYTLRPRRNGRHFPDGIFKCILLKENMWISIKIALKFVPKGPINYSPALVQIMAWHLPGDKPLSEPVMKVRLAFIEPMHHNKPNITYLLNQWRLVCRCMYLSLGLDNLNPINQSINQSVSQSVSITWTNVDSELCHFLPSLGHNEFKFNKLQSCRIMMVYIRSIWVLHIHYYSRDPL